MFFYAPKKQPNWCHVCHEDKKTVEYDDGEYIGHICADCLKVAEKLVEGQ